MQFNQSQTKISIARAFAGLCQDAARYQFMAKDARDDGMEYLSTLLEGMGKHKIGQSQRLYSLMLELSENKKDNVVIEAGYPFEDNKITISLERAGIIEEYEGKNLFAQFVRVATDEGFKEIAGVFELIGKVSYKHSRILKTLAQNYNKRQLYKNSKPLTWTCSNCGHSIEDKNAWLVCPLCKKPKGYVMIPEEKLTSGE